MQGSIKRRCRRYDSARSMLSHFVFRLQVKRINMFFFVNNGDFVRIVSEARAGVAQGVEHDQVQVFCVQLPEGVG